MPLVTTSVPAPLTSVPYLILKVTLGVVPNTTDLIAENVVEVVVKNKTTFSAFVGFNILIALGAADPVGPVTVEAAPVGPVTLGPVGPVDPVGPVGPVTP